MANDQLLPPVVRSLIDCDIAARTDSPAASLAAAQSGQEIADPPANFGAIRARNLLASKRHADRSRLAGEHIPRPAVGQKTDRTR